MIRGSVKFGECEAAFLAVRATGVWLILTVPHLALIRVYPIKEVPVEAEALTDWLYQRFVEKEELLAHFYETGLSRSS